MSELLRSPPARASLDADARSFKSNFISMPTNPRLNISDLLPGFIRYMEVERRFSPATIKKYHEDLEWFMRHIGNLPVLQIPADHFFAVTPLVGFFCTFR
jgi:hypothetical protein